jgi:hypothetical protein
MTTRRLLATTLAALPAVALLLAACIGRYQPRHVIAPTGTTPSPTAATSTGAGSPVAPVKAPSPPVESPLRPDPSITTPVIPAAGPATRTPVAVAMAWAIAANSSSYHDPSPGTWTVRAEPFVTGTEARAEAAQRRGRGGSTWAQIQADKCVTSLRGLNAAVPSDAPSSPAARVVYVSATTTLRCATGTVELSPFAAELIVRKTGGHWLVTRVTH